MGKIRDTLDALNVGDSFAFSQRQLFLVRAEIKSEPANKFLVRSDPKRQDDWRIWRQE